MITVQWQNESTFESWYRAVLRAFRAFSIWGLLIAVPIEVPASDMLSPAAYARISKLQNVLETGDHNQSRTLAEATLAENYIGSYEKAITLQILSQTKAAQGDYLAAARVLEEALSLNAFDKILARSTQYNLAHLYVVAGDLDAGLVLLKAWFEEAEKPSSAAFMLLAQVNAQLAEYAKALPPAISAVRLSKRPREDWYHFVSVLHYEVGDVASMAAILRTMVTYWPQQGRHWDRLAWAYESLEEPAEARAVLEMAKKQGVLIEEKQLLRLVQLYLHEGLPDRAARVVRQGLDDRIIDGTSENWKLLAEALVAAENQNAAALALEHAVDLTAGSALRVRLAQMYLGKERWRDVVRVAETGLQKIECDRIGELSFALGIAQFHLGNNEEARDAFVHAALEQKTKRGAEQWLDLLLQHINRTS